MKDARHIWEWQPSKRMGNTEQRRTGGNWGRCEGLLRRFHLVGRKYVLLYRRRRIFLSVYKFTSDILSLCHKVLESKISHWKWSCECRQQALYVPTRRMFNVRKTFENQAHKRHRITKKTTSYTYTYEIKRKYIKLRFFKYHAFKFWLFWYCLEKSVSSTQYKSYST